MTSLPVLVALGLMMLQNQAPAVPANVTDPNYPLRVQVAQTGWNSTGYSGFGGAFQGMTGYGHGNLLGSPDQGFDYTESCNQPFASRPEGNQYFRARWTRPKQKLEVLIQVLGSDRIVACELKIAMRDEPYELNPVRFGPQMIARTSRPAVPAIEPDPKFPLRLRLLTVRSSFGSQTSTHAEGFGNLIGPPEQGLDFANECPVHLAVGRNNADAYQARWARWVRQGLQLEILLHEVGTAEQTVCRMDVGMKSEPYPAPTFGARPLPRASVPATPSTQAPTSNSESPQFEP